MESVARRGPGKDVRDRIEALVRAFPEDHIHVVDMRYRLSAPAFADREVRWWEDERGALIAYAVWQPEFRTLDYGCDSGVAGKGLAASIVSWAVEWFEDRARSEGSNQTCWIKTLERSPLELSVVLEARGFSRCAWSSVRLDCDLSLRIDPSRPPPGFRIRRAVDRGDEELAALHRAIFPKVGMSDGWRRTMMSLSDYCPDLDLVAEAPDGALAAFCVGWCTTLPAGSLGEIEPLGTHPAFRGRGLGRAVLLEVTRRMQVAGVQRVSAKTWDDNLGAMHCYKSVGYAEAVRMPTFAREFAAPGASRS
jgi:mycothiol synthase